jgi:lipopolysaccharide export system protein LptA
MLAAASTYEFSCKDKTYKLLGNDGHLQSNIQHKGNKIMITCKNSTMRLETFC